MWSLIVLSREVSELFRGFVSGVSTISRFSNVRAQGVRAQRQHWTT